MKNTLVDKIVKKVLNEAFASEDVNRAVAEHGGADNRKKTIDIRSGVSNYDDISKMEVVGYIPKEVFQYLEDVMWGKPLSEQILFCNDGGALILNPTVTFDNEYKDKVKKRANKYAEDTGKEKSPYINVSKYDNMQRMKSHFEKRK